MPRPAESPRLQTLDYIQTARLPIAGSFDDYWSARGKNLRQNMRKQRAKLREGRRRDAPGDPDPRGGRGRRPSPTTGGSRARAGRPPAAPRYIRTTRRAASTARCSKPFAARARRRIYRYRFGDQVVAVDLCIEGGGALVILKTTYDESIKTISPAFLMREEAFRLLFDEGRVKRIEFFGKVMEWHTRWTGDVRTLYHVNYYRSSLVPRLKAAAARLRACGRSGAEPAARKTVPRRGQARRRGWQHDVRTPRVAGPIGKIRNMPR